MKHILLGAVALVFGLSVQAQESLFPELKGSAAQPQAAEPAQPARSVLNQAVGTEQQNADKSSAKGELIITMLEATIVVPPVEHMQFCSGSFMLTNDTKETVNSLNVLIKYGPSQVPYSFSGVPAGEEVRGTFALAGSGCEDLKNTPQITVTGCSVGDWSKEQCQNNVKFKLR